MKIARLFAIVGILFGITSLITGLLGQANTAGWSGLIASIWGLTATIWTQKENKQ